MPLVIDVLMLVQEVVSAQQKELGSPKHIDRESANSNAGKREEKVAKVGKEQSSTEGKKDHEKDVRPSESAESEGNGTNGESNDSV